MVKIGNSARRKIYLWLNALLAYLSPHLPDLQHETPTALSFGVTTAVDKNFEMRFLIGWLVIGFTCFYPCQVQPAITQLPRRLPMPSFDTLISVTVDVAVTDVPQSEQVELLEFDSENSSATVTTSTSAQLPLQLFPTVTEKTTSQDKTTRFKYLLETRNTTKRKTKSSPAAKVTLPAVLPYFTGPAAKGKFTQNPKLPGSQRLSPPMGNEKARSDGSHTGALPGIAVIIQTSAAVLTAVGEFF